MSIVDLFNTSFLVYLGILLLAIALLVVYFESKSREQNHKIASMFSIISTLAEDLNSVKLGFNQLAFNGYGGGPSLAENFQPFNISEQNKLIEVSDNEDDTDDDENSDDDNDNSDNENFDDDNSDDNDENSDDNDENFDDDNSDDEADNLESDYQSESNTIKILKISDPLLEKVEEKFDELDELVEPDEDYEQDNFEEEPLELVQNNFVPEENDKNNKNEKSIKIDLGEVGNENIDYKKLTLQKLKSIVTEKGLATDTSKLKKPDLLKLLGVE
jgi:hypothetical protein